MEIGETLYVHERQEWREWLERKHAEAPDIWLVLPNRSTGKPCMKYNDAVEEALCFGWIDSIVKKLNVDHAAQRYSPRNPGSGYSQMNIERLRWLIERDMVIPEVVERVKHLLEVEFVFPEDIIDAIRANDEAWTQYQGFSEPYKRIRIAYIDNGRERPEVFEKRLKNFIDKTARGKQYGHGGIEKYY